MSLLNQELQTFSHTSELPPEPDQTKRGAWKRQVELGVTGPLPQGFLSIGLAQLTEFENHRKRTEVIRLPLDRERATALRDFLTGLLKTKGRRS